MPGSAAFFGTRDRRGTKGALLIHSIGLRGQDEVAFRQAVDFVSPDFDSHPAPGEVEVRMMALLFCDGAHTVHKIQCIFEVGEGKGLGQVVLIDHLPASDLGHEVFQFSPTERRRTSAAGNALFFG